MEQLSDQQARAIVNAARSFRDAMRQYMAEQVAEIERGTPLNDLVANNWPSFQEVARAEEALFALLDALDGRDNQ